MSNVVLSPLARQDLAQIKTYVSDVLKNPGAARGVLKRITDQIRMLEQFSEMGTLLEPAGGLFPYRYLLCGSYMVFYHVQQDMVRVDRVLYARSDYMSVLFGEEIDLDS